MRLIGGVVNTAITVAAAQGIISARCPGKLQCEGGEGGDICIGKDWAKSLMRLMGFVRRKVPNACKVLPAEYAELKEQCLANIAAEMISQLILLSTGIKLGLGLFPRVNGL